jgi:hypothetical protein
MVEEWLRVPAREDRHFAQLLLTALYRATCGTALLAKQTKETAFSGAYRKKIAEWLFLAKALFIAFKAWPALLELTRMVGLSLLV